MSGKAAAALRRRPSPHEQSRRAETTTGADRVTRFGGCQGIYLKGDTMSEKLTEIMPGAGTPEVGEPIRASLQIPYVIVRTIRLTGDDFDTVAMVYGPYDQQGSAAAYKKLVAAGLGDDNAKLSVRGLFPTGDSRSVTV
jgi:hypothetical protein